MIDLTAEDEKEQHSAVSNDFERAQKNQASTQAQVLSLQSDVPFSLSSFGTPFTVPFVLPHGYGIVPQSQMQAYTPELYTTPFGLIGQFVQTPAVPPPQEEHTEASTPQEMKNSNSDTQESVIDELDCDLPQTSYLQFYPTPKEQEKKRATRPSLQPIQAQKSNEIKTEMKTNIYLPIINDGDLDEILQTELPCTILISGIPRAKQGFKNIVSSITTLLAKNYKVKVQAVSRLYKREDLWKALLPSPEDVEKLNGMTGTLYDPRIPVTFLKPSSSSKANLDKRAISKQITSLRAKTQLKLKPLKKKNWSTITLTALKYLISNSSEGRKYFSREEICSAIEINWETFCPHKKKLQDWHVTVDKQLRIWRDALFCSRGPLWGVRDINTTTQANTNSNVSKEKTVVDKRNYDNKLQYCIIASGMLQWEDAKHLNCIRKVIIFERTKMIQDRPVNVNSTRKVAYTLYQILGAAMILQHLHFGVRFNDGSLALLPAVILDRYAPQHLLTFYESRIVFGSESPTIRLKPNSEKTKETSTDIDFNQTSNTNFPDSMNNELTFPIPSVETSTQYEHDKEQ